MPTDTKPPLPEMHSAAGAVSVSPGTAEHATSAPAAEPISKEIWRDKSWGSFKPTPEEEASFLLKPAQSGRTSIGELRIDEVPPNPHHCVVISPVEVPAVASTEAL